MCSWQFEYIIVYVYGFQLLLNSVHIFKLCLECEHYIPLQNTSVFIYVISKT
jgi:hypothetical protein